MLTTKPKSSSFVYESCTVPRVSLGSRNLFSTLLTKRAFQVFRMYRLVCTVCWYVVFFLVSRWLQGFPNCMHIKGIKSGKINDTTSASARRSTIQTIIVLRWCSALWQHQRNICRQYRLFAFSHRIYVRRNANISVGMCQEGISALGSHLR